MKYYLHARITETSVVKPYYLITNEPELEDPALTTNWPFEPISWRIGRYDEIDPILNKLKYIYKEITDDLHERIILGEASGLWDSEVKILVEKWIEHLDFLLNLQLDCIKLDAKMQEKARDERKRRKEEQYWNDLRSQTS